MLSNEVNTLSTKLATNSPTFAFPLARPVSIFSHADFIEATEPDIVALASLAVVPVIPISV